jgi:hypothetical protein
LDILEAPDFWEISDLGYTCKVNGIEVREGVIVTIYEE